MQKTIISLLLLLPLAAAAQKSYTVSGELPGLKAPAKAYLEYGHGATAFEDSTDIKNGKFRFTGSVSAPIQAILTVKRSNAAPAKAWQQDYLPFFIENSAITITGTDSIKKSTVTGSLADRENREVEAAIRPLTNTIIKLNDEFRGKPKDAAYKQASDSVTRLVAEIKNIRLKFVESHLNSFMGLYTYNINILDSKFEPAKVEPLFHRFSPALQSSELGRQTLEKIEIAKRRQPGVKATDFTEMDLNDHPFKLSSLRGKYVLVDFWASWCVPCRAENPNLVKAYQQLKGKNFEVVGVSLDQGKEAWKYAVEKDGLPWIHVCDLKGWKNHVATLYGINSVPQNLLINPEGVIIAKNLRGEDLTEKLTALIK